MSVENPEKQQTNERPEYGAFTALTPVEMARATGVNHRQLRRWAREHGLPQNHDGTYSLPKFVNWIRKADVGRPRPYRRRPSAIEKRIVERVQIVLKEELAAFVGGTNGGRDSPSSAPAVCRCGQAETSNTKQSQQAK